MVSVNVGWLNFSTLLKLHAAEIPQSSGFFTNYCVEIPGLSRPLRQRSDPAEGPTLYMQWRPFNCCFTALDGPMDSLSAGPKILRSIA
jgi:hypothetical protein